MMKKKFEEKLEGKGYRDRRKERKLIREKEKKERQEMISGHRHGLQDDCPCFYICLLICLFVAFPVRAEVQLDFEKIAQIESGGNPRAWNKADNSRGLYQITPICLEEYNHYHANNTYSMKDLWDSSVNRKIADWYLTVRIPQMLRYYNKPDTIENRLICFNAGISYLINNKPLPKTTLRYLEKYFK
jgi:hypothetical protein